MADIHYFPAPASGVTIGTGITAVGAANAAGSSTNASADDHVHRGALESGSYAAPAALQAAGVLQQTYSAPTATLAIATIPAGRVPAGAAAGTGVLRTDDKLFYYEAPATTQPRLNIGTDTAWASETNVEAGLRLFAAAGTSRETVIQLEGNDASTIRAYQTSDGLFIGQVRFEDGSDGITSGAVVISARQSTGDGGATVESSRHSAAGVLIRHVLGVGPAGISETMTGAFIWLQNNGTVAVAPSGTSSITHNGTNNWPQVSADGGAFADIARASQGTAAASGSTLTLPSDGTYLHVTGTTTINYITTARVRAGHIIWLYFEGALTLNHNAGTVPGGTFDLQLATGANTSMAAASTTAFVRDNTLSKWVQLSSP